jgi:hypothetical protein
MSLAEKRRMERAKEVLKSHPDYVRIALERVYGSGKVIANLVKEIAWLRGIERELDTLVLEHLVKNDYVAQLEGRRYGITIRGKKLIDDHATMTQIGEVRKVANG